jgi:outer membrane autotransporter protein
VRSYLDAAGGTPAARQKQQNSAWVDGFGEVADQGADKGFTGFKYSLTGVGAGLDSLVKDGLIVGVSFGKSHTSITFDGDRAQGDVGSTYGSLYGSLFDDHAYLDMALSYGRQSYKNNRLVEVGSLSGIARSSHEGDSYSAYAETGYNLAMEKWLLQPFASLQYTYLDEEGYRESGVSGVNLIVDDRETDSLVSDLGMRFIRPFDTGTLKLVPDVTVAWRHDYDIANRIVTAAFDGAPDTSFTTDSRDVDKDGIIIGGGVTLLNKSGVSMYLRYDSEMRPNYDSQRMSGGIRLEF